MVEWWYTLMKKIFEPFFLILIEIPYWYYADIQSDRNCDRKLCKKIFEPCFLGGLAVLGTCTSREFYNRIYLLIQCCKEFQKSVYREPNLIGLANILLKRCLHKLKI